MPSFPARPSLSPALRETFKSILDRALSEPLGLYIECVNPKSFEVQISRIKSVYPNYDSLMVCIPSLPETVFLVKKSVELEP